KTTQKEEGLKMGPVFSLGYLNGKKKGEVIIHEPAAKIVREIYRRYIDGASQRDLVTWLNENHMGELNTYGKKYYDSTVRRILTNPLYIGLCPGPNNELIKSQAYEPIFENSEIFMKAKAIREVRRNPKHGKKVADHLLSGLLSCGCCNKNLTPYPRYHKKTNERTGFEYKCHHTECRKPKAFTMQEFLWDEWANEIIAHSWIEPNQKVDYTKANNIKLQIEQVEKNIRDLTEEFINGENSELDLELYKKLKERSGQRKKELTDDLEQCIIEDDSEEVFNFISWPQVSFEDRKIAIKQDSPKIEVFNKFILRHTRKRIFFYPLINRYIPGRASARRFNALIPINKKFKEMIILNVNKIDCFCQVWDDDVFLDFLPVDMENDKFAIEKVTLADGEHDFRKFTNPIFLN
ncbi:MAG: recombinase family protein, partial [Lentisphaeria bacterium]|nr:recombinase family protein [Lentisphaeria bacterium]